MAKCTYRHTESVQQHVNALISTVVQTVITVWLRNKQTLTVASSSVANSERCQVVQETLEIKGRQRRFKSDLMFIKPVKWKDRKDNLHYMHCIQIQIVVKVKKTAQLKRQTE